MNDHENCTASGAMDFSESLKRQWTRNRLPYAVLLELTPRCNFNCVHCYLQDHHAEDFLSKDDVIQMLDLLYDEGILFLTLTGGEVLTRKDFAEIYAYAKRKGFLMEVFTNADRGSDCPFSTVATVAGGYFAVWLLRGNLSKNHRRKRRICQSDGELPQAEAGGRAHEPEIPSTDQ